MIEWVTAGKPAVFHCVRGDDMRINRLDHLVLTVKDIAITVDFYVYIQFTSIPLAWLSHQVT
jgi:uncharacterized protein (UPF0128 family)